MIKRQLLIPSVIENPVIDQCLYNPNHFVKWDQESNTATDKLNYLSNVFYLTEIYTGHAIDIYAY